MTNLSPAQQAIARAAAGPVSKMNRDLGVVDLPITEQRHWLWRGHRIAYVETGNPDAPPLVLLHGFGASLGHWRHNISAIAQGGYRVFALDLLGFGASDKPAIAYSMELWEELVKDFWTDKIQRPTVWVGNSIGGLLALMLAARSPDRTAGAVLLNCAGGLNHRPEELNPLLRLVMGTFAQAVNTPVIGPLLFNVIRRKRNIRNTLCQVYGNPAAVTDDLVEMLHRPACDPGAQAVFAAILSAPPGPMPAELLPAVHGPLLVLWGEADPWTPIDGATPYRQLATVDARVQFQAIADTGHCPHDERPEIVNTAILDWLKQLKSGSASRIQSK